VWRWDATFRNMAIEHKVRSVGTKTITYPWLRRYVVVGPYNRHVRHDAAVSLVSRLFGAAAASAARRRNRTVDQNRG
jgi:hypothetical protein